VASTPELADAAARVAALWREYRSGPVPTRLVEMLDAYAGGASGYVLDLELLARDWITSRAAEAGAATCPPAPASP